MKKISLIQLVVLASLGSCSSTKSTWDCPILNGATNCSPIKNSDVMSGGQSEAKSSFDVISPTAQKIEIKLVAPKLSDLKKIQKELSNQAEQRKQLYENNLLEEKVFQDDEKKDKRLRTQEKIGKVWFAPHIDSDSNQHSEKVVYVVDEESRWVGQK